MRTKCVEDGVSRLSCVSVDVEKNKNKAASFVSEGKKKNQTNEPNVQRKNSNTRPKDWFDVDALTLTAKGLQCMT